MATKIFSEPTEILPILDQYPHNTAFIVSEHFDTQTKYLRCIYKAGVLSKIEQYLYHAKKWTPYKGHHPPSIPKYIHTIHYPSVSISGYLTSQGFIADDMSISCRRLFRYSSAINTLKIDYGFQVVNYGIEDQYFVSQLYLRYVRQGRADGVVIRVDDLSLRDRYIILEDTPIERVEKRYYKPVGFGKNEINVAYT
jgi:hypothetical protein|nr:MAG TPA: hypothetical protein [Caudoviricetes sp.]